MSPTCTTLKNLIKFSSASEKCMYKENHKT